MPSPNGTLAASVRRALAIALALGLAPLSASAKVLLAWTVRDAKLFADKKAGSRVIETVPKRVWVYSWWQPVDGFYKVQVRKGVVGYLEQDAIRFKDPAAAAAAGSQASSQANGSPRGSSRGPRFEVKGWGTFALFNSTDLNTQFSGGGVQFTSFNGGMGFGAEARYFVSRSLALGIRVERIAKSVTDDSVPVTLDLSGMPLLAGLHYRIRPGVFSLGVGVYGGYGLLSFSSTRADQPAPNVTTLKSGGVAFLGALEVAYRFDRSFFGFLDAGYRMLQTKKVTPSTIGNGSDYFLSTTNPTQYEPLALQMSGLNIAVGVGASF